MIYYEITLNEAFRKVFPAFKLYFSFYTHQLSYIVHHAVLCNYKEIIFVVFIAVKYVSSFYKSRQDKPSIMYIRFTKPVNINRQICISVLQKSSNMYLRFTKR